MPKPTDVRPVAVELYFLPIKTRVPLKFGPEVTTEVTCARVKMTVEDRQGKRPTGWGETPLRSSGSGPASLSYEERHQALRGLSLEDRRAPGCRSRRTRPSHGSRPSLPGQVLPGLTDEFNANRAGATREGVPLAGGIGVRVGLRPRASRRLRRAPRRSDLRDLQSLSFMNHDLAHFLKPAAGRGRVVRRRFPEDFLVRPRLETIPAWHLIGGKDPVDARRADRHRAR